MVETVNDLVIRARGGDLDGYGRLVQATQTMAYAVAVGVVRDPGLAEDAVQDAYLRTFRRLHDLDEPPAFIGWFRHHLQHARRDLGNLRSRVERTALASRGRRAHSQGNRDHLPGLR